MIDQNCFQLLQRQIGVESTAEVLRIFETSVSEIPQLIQRSLDTHNHDELKRLGHKFKSSSATLGALEFSKLCSRLEATESLGEAERLANELGLAVELLKNEVHHILEAGQV